LTLDANGWLVQITNPAGGTHKAAYSENGLMSSFTDLNNNTSTMEYDDLGRLVYDRTAAGKVWTVSRGELIKGKEVGLTTALGRTLKYRVQDLPTGDHLRVNTSADGRVTESLRKTDGSTTVTTPTGLVHTVKKTPDPRFKMAAPLPSSKQTMPSGLTRETNDHRTVSLSDPNDPLSLTDETTTVTMNGQIYTTVFSSATHTISGMTPTGRKSVALLDTRGRVSQSKTGTLAPASYAYDAHGRLGELTQGEGADSRSAQFSYGTDGNLKTVTDALGRHVDFEHDVLGRVTKQTLPDGRETRTTYDANGNVTIHHPARKTSPHLHLRCRQPSQRLHRAKPWDRVHRHHVCL
jgi:YD repeat-containing protein